MSSTLSATRLRTELSKPQRRSVRVLTWAPVVCLFGASSTGLWQFFAHESDPRWVRLRRR